MESNKVAAFISKKRRDKGLTQQQVAEQLKVSFQAVSKWESGTTFPNTDLLLNLSDLLGVSVDELLRGKEKQTNSLTYSQAGVNLHYTERLKEKLKDHVKSDSPRILNGVGPFASLIDIKFDDIENPILVMKTEDPGSKQKIAFDFGYINSICHDMINHLVNDIAVMGADPLSVSDNIICGSVENETVISIVKSISEACRENNCYLTGGKTTIQKGIVDRGTYLLSSSITGICDRKNIIDGSKIEEGDIVVAVASNGLHTNGYSLIRLLMDEMPHIKREKIGDENFIDVIMRPHLSYYKMISSFKKRNLVSGMAHITGGGLEANISRIMPEGLSSVINLNKLKVHQVFKFIKHNGNISQNEMLNTFNCGVGLIMIVKPELKNELIRHNSKFYDSYEIGLVTRGEDKVVIKGMIDW